MAASGKSQATSQTNVAAPAETAESETTRLMARARVMMIISMLTTALAIAAVVAVIGYRLLGAGGGNSLTISNGTVFLPQGARVVSTSVSAGRIIVTLDISGASEVRIFDLKTLQQIGQLHFAAEH
jgi:hypothetical protein